MSRAGYENWLRTSCASCQYPGTSQGSKACGHRGPTAFHLMLGMWKLLSVWSWPGVLNHSSQHLRGSGPQVVSESQLKSSCPSTLQGHWLSSRFSRPKTVAFHLTAEFHCQAILKTSWEPWTEAERNLDMEYFNVGTPQSTCMHCDHKGALMSHSSQGCSASGLWGGGV